MSDLAPRVSEFSADPVVFMSILSEGWGHRSTPTPRFLMEWKNRYRISFPVLAAPRDFGKDFNPEGYIPNVAIIDQNGKLAFKEVAPSVSSIFRKVHQLLGH